MNFLPVVPSADRVRHPQRQRRAHRKRIGQNAGAPGASISLIAADPAFSVTEVSPDHLNQPRLGQRYVLAEEA